MATPGPCHLPEHSTFKSSHLPLAPRSPQGDLSAQAQTPRCRQESCSFLGSGQANSSGGPECQAQGRQCVSYMMGRMNGGHGCRDGCWEGTPEGLQQVWNVDTYGPTEAQRPELEPSNEFFFLAAWTGGPDPVPAPTLLQPQACTEPWPRPLWTVWRVRDHGMGVHSASTMLSPDSGTMVLPPLASQFCLTRTTASPTGPWP
ncbi:uncharacterized protein [Symphalangus syndactylus]|uniref:uncharacterized protein isoform X2 n=1 Tax=Symphalangus syndactylus TaxID=9590 RepID=UPI00300510FF